MKRVFDLVLVILLGAILIVPIIFIAAMVRFSSKGGILYWSDRVGRNGVMFKMPKFRTMHIGTPAVATHLLGNPGFYITPVGGFLRKTSLDELPQVWSIFKGEMSFVGPRPALFNQHDLIALRVERGVDKLVPGLTGWAQINGRDELSVNRKVEFDCEYLVRQSVGFDLRIIIMTVGKVVSRERVSH